MIEDASLAYIQLVRFDIGERYKLVSGDPEFQFFKKLCTTSTPKLFCVSRIYFSGMATHRPLRNYCRGGLMSRYLNFGESREGGNKISLISSLAITCQEFFYKKKMTLAFVLSGA